MSEDVFLDQLRRVARAHDKMARPAFARFQDATKTYPYEDGTLFRSDDPAQVDGIPALFRRFHNRDGNGPRSRHTRPTCLYSAGKVAWHPGDCVVVVDDLRTMTRASFAVPNGPMIAPHIELVAFGNKLVIGRLGHLLVAWDHHTSQNAQVNLPGPVKNCSTRNHTVAIVMSDNSVLVWRFGGKLSAVQLEPTLVQLGLPVCTGSRTRTAIDRGFFDPKDDMRRAIVRGFVDPKDDSTILVASAFKSVSGSFMRAVHELRDGVCTRCFEHQPRPDSVRRFRPTLNVTIDSVHNGRTFLGIAETFRGPDPDVVFDVHGREFVTPDDETVLRPWNRSRAQSSSCAGFDTEYYVARDDNYYDATAL
ncbi:hypothetical protein GGR56DRAFT_631705 [Xylariaceae sp. FL0804]|nr:hypothetical protein GGR56DRAFT_631705 [Xylariaceae sp. FL0804]